MAEEKRPSIEELRATLGKTKKVEILEIDKSILNAFCESIEDPNPKWKEEAHPGFLTAVWLSGSFPALQTPLPYKRGVAGGGDWDYFKPIKVGDE